MAGELIDRSAASSAKGRDCLIFIIMGVNKPTICNMINNTLKMTVFKSRRDRGVHACRSHLHHANSYIFNFPSFGSLNASLSIKYFSISSILSPTKVELNAYALKSIRT